MSADIARMSPDIAFGTIDIAFGVTEVVLHEPNAAFAIPDTPI
jgi:hypothetical protein